jgi:hypothetical protein
LELLKQNALGPDLGLGGSTVMVQEDVMPVGAKARLATQKLPNLI